MRDPFVKPGKEAAKAIERAPQFLVVSYPDPSGKTGTADIAPWKKLCAVSEPLILPAGKNIIEAKRDGVDLWRWVADALKPGIAPGPGVKTKRY